MTGPLSRALEPVYEAIDRLRVSTNSHASFRKATVTSLGPLRIQFDGEETPRPITPDTLAPVRPGDRVVVAHHGGRARTQMTIINRIGGTGTGLLDEKQLSGQVGAGTDLVVPVGQRGQYRQYVIQVQAGVEESPSDNVRPLMVLINGDNGSNYRVQAEANHPSLGRVSFQNLDSTAWPRTGFVGSNRGNLSIEFSVDSFGAVAYMPWRTSGWANGIIATGGGFSVIGGGRWSGQEQLVSHFTVRTTVGSETWRTTGADGISTARLWGYR